MHKHNGIVVVAFATGQKASEIAALLADSNFTEFTTKVVAPDGQEGMAANVNLHDEAVDLAQDVNCFGANDLEAFIHGDSDNWRVSED